MGFSFVQSIMSALSVIAGCQGVEEFERGACMQGDQNSWYEPEAPPLSQAEEVERPPMAVDPGYVQSLPSDLSVRTLRCLQSQLSPSLLTTVHAF